MIVKCADKEQERTKKGNTDKLIIKAKGKTYAELLKEVKGSIDVEGIGVEVRSVKKTMQGDLFMEIKGGREKANTVRESIKANIDTEVTIKTNDTVVHII